LAWARRPLQDVLSGLRARTLPKPVETSEPMDDAGVRLPIDVPGDTPWTLTATQLMGNDPDPDGGTLTVASVSRTADGTAELSAKDAAGAASADSATVSLAVDSADDSTAAMQAKFDALRQGDTLILDAGIFNYSSSLYIRTSNVSVIGNGTTLNSTNPASAALIIQAVNVTLSNVSLTAPVGLDRVDSTDRTRLVFGGTGVHISDVTITGGTSAGVYVTGGSNFLMERVAVQDTAADGVQIANGSHDGILNDVTTLRTGDDGIAIVSYQVPLYGTVHDITVNNPVVHGTGQRGLVSASNSSTEPKPHAPATSAGFHHGSEYQPAGTGRPATRPPG
jgi:Bacterial cadherin-like domain/Right handed beta helix region